MAEAMRRADNPKDQGPGADSQNRNDPGISSLGDASPEDIEGILSRSQVDEDAGKDKDPVVMDSQHSFKKV
jgi:hypothetical protein